VDVATCVGISQKVLDIIRALPFWLLVAVSIILAGLHWYPALSAPLPQEWKPWIPFSAFCALTPHVCQRFRNGNLQLADEKNSSKCPEP
jgi:hypothetical protein